MTDTISPSASTLAPVIYVHARGCEPAGQTQIQALLELGSPLCSRLANDELEQTSHGFDQPDKLLTELAGRYPGRPVIFLRAGLQPSKQQLDQLTAILMQAGQPLALTLLSNADTALNPFAGLAGPENIDKNDLSRLVGLLAPGLLHRLNTWTDHFVMLSAELVGNLAENPSYGTMMQQVLAAGGTLELPDQLFLHDRSKRVFTALKLQPHESTCPPPFGELSARLQTWFDAGITDLPVAAGEEKPATLHITHNWGGGVAQWLKSFITADSGADSGQRHFQLRSESPQSGPGYGQKLCLYAGNELRCPVARNCVVRWQAGGCSHR